MGTFGFVKIVILLRTSVVALVCLLLAGCSLIESLNEGTEARSPIPVQTASVNVMSEGNYLESCRAKGVPSSTRLEAVFI